MRRSKRTEAADYDLAFGESSCWNDASEGGPMCLSCGCGEPDADHGDPRHITMEALRKAAEAAEISPQEAADNIKATVAKAS